MRRGLLLAAAPLAALALATVALAKNTASVAVSHGSMSTSATTSTTIHVSIPQATDPIARVAIYAPAGYTANLSAAAGTNIGSVDATGFARDTGLTLPLTGNVVTDNPANYTSNPCAPGVHAAVWILNLSVAGQAIQLPVYVDPTSGAETALGSVELVTCLGPPDVPQGTPGRSPFGTQLLDAKFTVNNVLTTPGQSALLHWETLFTPYNPGQGTANVLGTFEAQSLVGIPETVSLKAVSVRHRTFKVTGTITEGGTPAAGVSVQFYRGASSTKLVRVTSAKTGANGTFSFGGTFGKARQLFFQAKASAGERDAACVAALPAAIAPGGCATATLSPWAASSAVVKAKK
jgi:hypothetical protein